MINTELNERITITLTKKQIAWIRDQAEKKSITPSKFISWLLGLKIREIEVYLKANNQSISRDLKNTKFTDEQLEEIIRRAKTPWIQEEDY